MKVIIASILIFGTVSGCSTTLNSIDLEKPQKALEFSKVEEIDFTKFSKDGAREIFGSPDDVSVLEGGVESWIYLTKQDQSYRLNLQFLEDKTLGATWFFRKEDDATSLKDLLSRYGKSMFRKREVGSRGTHYYSDDLIYTNHKRGVSLYYLSGVSEVLFASFSQPQVGRELTGQSAPDDGIWEKQR